VEGRKTIRPLKIWIAILFVSFKTQMFQVPYLCKYETYACKNLTLILKGIVEENNCHYNGCTENQEPFQMQIQLNFP
jgi:hypothetical protein